MGSSELLINKAGVDAGYFTKRFLLRHKGTDVRLLPHTSITVGRDPGCDICVDDDLASRSHARLRVETDEIYLEDLHSRNGVFVNGSQISAPQRLEGGDWFRIGRSEFGLRIIIVSRLDLEQITKVDLQPLPSPRESKRTMPDPRRLRSR